MSGFDEKLPAKNLVITESTGDSGDNELADHDFIGEYADDLNPLGLAIAKPDDKHRYRSVSTRPPLVCYLILLVEFAERGSYYGTQGILNNFIMRPLPEGSIHYR